MCQKNSSTPKISGEQPQFTTRSGVCAAILYDLPTYKENKVGGYIEFYAYDPEQGKMRRKRIKLNRIKGLTNRRAYARQVIKRLADQLNKGWNPWIAKDTSDLMTFEDAASRYEIHIEKMLAQAESTVHMLNSEDEEFSIIDTV